MSHTDYPNGSAPWDKEKKKKVLIGTLIISAIILTIIIIIVLCTVDKKQPAFEGHYVLNAVPLLDGSNQIAEKLRLCAQNNLDALMFHRNLTKSQIWGEDGSCNLQADIPRLKSGKVSGLLFTASAPCSTQYKDATAWVLEQIDVLKRLVRKYPDNLMLATKASDLNDAFDKNKIASFLAVSGGHVIDSRVAIVRALYDIGVRVLALAPECNTPWIQGMGNNYSVSYGSFTTDISDWGRLLVKEMNRIGMVIDMTGASLTALEAVIGISKAPIIITQTFLETHLAIPTSYLKMIGDHDGLVMLSLDSQALVSRGQATIDNLIDQINYLAGIVGIDNIGLASGFGNIKNTILNFTDVSGYPNLFDKLYEKTGGKIQWNEENLEKLASGNFLRVLKHVEKIRSSGHDDHEFSHWIDPDELNSSSPDAFSCRSANTENGIIVTTINPPTTKATTTLVTIGTTSESNITTIGSSTEVSTAPSTPDPDSTTDSSSESTTEFTTTVNDTFSS